MSRSDSMKDVGVIRAGFCAGSQTGWLFTRATFRADDESVTVGHSSERETIADPWHVVFALEQTTR